MLKQLPCGLMQIVEIHNVLAIVAITSSTQQLPMEQGRDHALAFDVGRM